MIEQAIAQDAYRRRQGLIRLMMAVTATAPRFTAQSVFSGGVSHLAIASGDRHV